MRVCDHDLVVECCSFCCRFCFQAEQLDARLEDERSHPFYGHGWPTYHRMTEKPARVRTATASRQP